MVAPVPRKLLSAAEAGGADVDAVAGFADRICAFDSDRVGEIAAAAVAFDLEARLCHGCWASGVEMGRGKGRDGLWISSGGWGSLFLWVMVIG